MGNLCVNCGASIVDAEILIKKYGNPPKRCEVCRREHRGYRKQSNVQRELLRQWQGVRIKRMYYNKEKTPTTNKEKYFILSIGGRNFGENWSGVCHNGKYIVMFDKHAMKEDPEAIVFCNIREMQKTTIVDGVERKNIYYVFDRATEGSGLILDYLSSWDKTTMRGYGRDRNYGEHIESAGGEVINYETLITSSSRARSGRFGTKVEHIIIDSDDYIIVGEGVK